MPQLGSDRAYSLEYIEASECGINLLKFDIVEEARKLIFNMLLV